MASMSDHHQTLTNGVGKCSVPMWMGGLPAGFCDAPAYGNPMPYTAFRNENTGEMTRADGGYTGYVPALACPGHGGPMPKHFGDPCVHCGIAHDDVPVGPCVPNRRTPNDQR